MCWVKSSQDCERRITANDLTPADDVRVLVTDFKGGGTKYEDRLEKEGQSDANESVKDNLDDLIKVVRSDSSNLKARFESIKAVGQVYQAGTLKSHERERVKEISVKTKEKVQTTKAKTSKIGNITGDSNDKSQSESRPDQVKLSGVKRKGAIIEVLPGKKCFFAVVAAKIRFGTLICFFDNCISNILPKFVQPTFLLWESFFALDLENI